MEELPRLASQDASDETAVGGDCVSALRDLVMEDEQSAPRVPSTITNETSESGSITPLTTSSIKINTVNLSALSPTAISEGTALASLADSATPRNHLFLSTLAETTFSRLSQKQQNSSSSSLNHSGISSHADAVEGGAGAMSSSQRRTVSSSLSDEARELDDDEEEITDDNEPPLPETPAKGKGKAREIVSNSGSKFSHRQNPSVEVEVGGSMSEIGNVIV